MKPQAYVSGALTNSSKKNFYDAIGEVMVKCGYRPYIPHHFTDPVKNPHVTPNDVYDLDMEEVMNSALITAEVTNPSLGVGAELERAAASNIPIILLHEKNARVSRLIRGIPTIRKIIEYSSEEEALKSLAEIITGE